MTVSFIIDGYAADPVLSVAGDSSTTFTVAAFPGSRIMLGAADNKPRNFIISLSLLQASSVNYCSEIMISGSLMVASGVYTVGNKTFSQTMTPGGGTMYTSIDIDVNSSNLRVRMILTNVTVDCYATIAIKGV